MIKNNVSWTMFKWLIILNWQHLINRRCQNLRCNETTSICAAFVVEPFPTFLKSWTKRRKHHIKSRTIEGTFIVLNKSIKQKLFPFAIFVLNIIHFHHSTNLCWCVWFGMKLTHWTIHLLGIYLFHTQICDCIIEQLPKSRW